MWGIIGRWLHYSICTVAAGRDPGSLILPIDATTGQCDHNTVVREGLHIRVYGQPGDHVSYRAFTAGRELYQGELVESGTLVRQVDVPAETRKIVLQASGEVGATSECYLAW
ncbi:MAG: hypothetical protein Q4A82_06115 [Corynebacterium sp.]|nr:hypothetical protein [Corynebacterium sp.]